MEWVILRETGHTLGLTHYPDSEPRDSDEWMDEDALPASDSRTWRLEDFLAMGQELEKKGAMKSVAVLTYLLVATSCCARGTAGTQSVPRGSSVSLDAFAVGSKNVRVVVETPALDSRGKPECEHQERWRAEWVAPVVLLGTPQLVGARHLKHAAFFDKDADMAHGVASQLKDDEVAFALSPRELIMYSRTSHQIYCVYVVEGADILVILRRVAIMQIP